jgi:hypothetical protein
MDDRDPSALDSAKTQQIRLGPSDASDDPCAPVLPARLRRRLEHLAASDGRSVADLIIDAVQQYLDRCEPEE